MSSTITDRQVLAFIERTESFYPPDAVEFSVAEQRALYDRMSAAFRQPRPPGLTVVDEVLDGAGAPVPARRYTPASPGPARVLYFHGGGFVVGGLDSHDDVCAEIAARVGVEVVSADYRLCPEHPHPAAYRDALAAVDALADRPLVVAGDSAGGNLAAAVALARGHLLRGQVLIYPGLGGDRLGLASYTERARAPLLSAEEVSYYREIRAGGPPPVGDPSFCPLAARDLSGLPRCFVSAAEHDPVRDDGVEWVRRLREAGIEAEAVVEPDLPHGHLRARTMSARAAAAFDRVVEAIGRFAVG